MAHPKGLASPGTSPNRTGRRSTNSIVQNKEIKKQRYRSTMKSTAMAILIITLDKPHHHFINIFEKPLRLFLHLLSFTSEINVPHAPLILCASKRSSNQRSSPQVASPILKVFNKYH
jgi:hypothetical protein